MSEKTEKKEGQLKAIPSEGQASQPAPNAKVVNEELLNALFQYLFSKPMGEVRGLVIGLEQAPNVYVKPSHK